jgi:ABC-2 type transport system permease protein
MLNHQARAIVWAQWRTTRNYLPRAGLPGMVFSGFLMLAWHSLFVFLAFVLASLFSQMRDVGSSALLPNTLLGAFLYWQVIPVLMVSMGSSLDLKKLLAYPIPHSELFAIETVLRLTTGVEVLIVLAGISVGLARNPGIPWWGPVWVPAFVLFNLFLSTGVREALGRLLAKKRIREILIVLFVLMAAVPQLLVSTTGFRRWTVWFSSGPAGWLPWTAAARVMTGSLALANPAILLLWIAAAYAFGRWQFERGLRFDAAESESGSAIGPVSRAGRMEGFYRLPSRLLSDPLGALIEKELRMLTRAPRFRLVFIMGFSFGLLIWAPLAFGRAGSSFVAGNYLMMVCVYSLLLLSEVLFWNVFGFDRSAAQVYFVSPLKLSTVLAAKNITALFFVLLEITAISATCLVLRLPFSGIRFAEALTVTLVVSQFLFCIGNMSSVYNPRPVNPVKSFRTSASGRAQAVIMLAFPLALSPVALGFAARYAFDSELAFFGVMLFSMVMGALVYRISVESALAAADQRKESIIAALSRTEGPVES